MAASWRVLVRRLMPCLAPVLSRRWSAMKSCFRVQSLALNARIGSWILPTIPGSDLGLDRNNTFWWRACVRSKKAFR